MFLCVVSPGDYDLVSTGTILAFDACDTQRCVEISIVDDVIVELTEPFFVTLERTTGLDRRIILYPIDAKVDITDNDGMCTVLLTWEIQK